MNEGRNEFRAPMLRPSFYQLSTSPTNDSVHGDVVGFGKSVRHLLAGEADADFLGIGAGLGEDAIVETFAAAKATAF